MDAVSGATFSSNSIMDAVADALGAGSAGQGQPAGDENGIETVRPEAGGENGSEAGQPGSGEGYGHGNGFGAGHPGNGGHGGRSGSGRHRGREN